LKGDLLIRDSGTLIVRIWPVQSDIGLTRKSKELKNYTPRTGRKAGNAAAEGEPPVASGSSVSPALIRRWLGARGNRECIVVAEGKK